MCARYNPQLEITDALNAFFENKIDKEEAFLSLFGGLHIPSYGSGDERVSFNEQCTMVTNRFFFLQIIL